MYHILEPICGVEETDLISSNIGHNGGPFARVFGLCYQEHLELWRPYHPIMRKTYVCKSNSPVTVEFKVSR